MEGMTMDSLLFSPLHLRGLTMENRIVIAPMCQYSAVDGLPGDWHLVHLGQMAQSGAGLMIVEATGVVPEGRISPGCIGLYDDATEAALARLVRHHRAFGGGAIGIQLVHAGRKASTAFPWQGGIPVPPEAGGWVPQAPSALPYLPGWQKPLALDGVDLDQLCRAFVDAARRAERAGFDLIEIHAAHGYLLHQFLSPLSNRRDDAHGGTLENRMRFPLAVFSAVREAVSGRIPVTVRISASDWIEGGWDVGQSVAFCESLGRLGCDLIHVSSGGLDARQRITTGPGYQTGFAAEIRARTGLLVIAVGQITEPVQAETILRSGQADAVALARAMLWNPRWPWHAAQVLGGKVTLPVQYERSAPALRGRPYTTGKTDK
jgi:2,4-dienoyl-CoA reductase-like NADH-dependent reductase (Old Yellow Enzyme family)